MTDRSRRVAVVLRQHWSGAYEPRLEGSARDESASVPLDLVLHVRLASTSNGCRATAEGVARMGGAAWAPARGRFWSVAHRRYTVCVRVWFRAPTGDPYRLDGRVQFDGRSPVWSVSRCCGVLHAGRQPLGSAELRLDLRHDLLRLVRSLRVTFRSP